MLLLLYAAILYLTCAPRTACRTAPVTIRTQCLSFWHVLPTRLVLFLRHENSLKFYRIDGGHHHTSFPVCIQPAFLFSPRIYTIVSYHQWKHATGGSSLPPSFNTSANLDSHISQSGVISVVSLSLFSLFFFFFAFWWLYVRSFSLILQRLFFETITVQYTQLCNTLNFLFFFFVFVIRYIVRLAVYTRLYSSIAMGYTKRTRMRHRGGQQQPAESCWIVHGSIRHVRSNSTK